MNMWATIDRMLTILHKINSTLAVRAHEDKCNVTGFVCRIGNRLFLGMAWLTHLKRSKGDDHHSCPRIGNLLQRGFQRGNVEASGESGKVAKEDEVEALINFSTTQDLFQGSGTPCLGLHKKKIKSVWK